MTKNNRVIPRDIYARSDKYQRNIIATWHGQNFLDQAYRALGWSVERINNRRSQVAGVDVRVVRSTITPGVPGRHIVADEKVIYRKRDHFYCPVSMVKDHSGRRIHGWLMAGINNSGVSHGKMGVNKGTKKQNGHIFFCEPRTITDPDTGYTKVVDVTITVVDHEQLQQWFVSQVGGLRAVKRGVHTLANKGVDGARIAYGDSGLFMTINTKTAGQNVVAAIPREVVEEMALFRQTVAVDYTFQPLSPVAMDVLNSSIVRSGGKPLTINNVKVDRKKKIVAVKTR